MNGTTTGRTITGEDTLSTAARTQHARSLAAAALRRFVEADGSSHTRALAYQSTFVVLSGFVGLVGLASVLGVSQIRLAVQHMASTLSPGPGGKLLEEAARRGASGAATAAVFGLLAALGAGTLAMAQVERSANRLAGVSDRRGLERFVRAAGLAASAGLILVIGALLLAGGQAIASGLGWRDTALAIWSVVRWPLGILAIAVGTYLLFRWAPRDEIGPRRAVWAGVGVAAALWALFTLGLALYLSVGGGKTYGPLLSIVALLLWAVLTSLALHLGLSVTYELRSRMRPGTVRLPDSATPTRDSSPTR